MWKNPWDKAKVPFLTLKKEKVEKHKLDPPTEGAMADEDDFEPVVKNFLNLISLMKLENSFDDQKNKNNTA